MNEEITRIFPCPTCGKPSILTKENAFRPFCCERCKLIDLGAWAAEDHKIAGDELLLEQDDQDQY
ncbi:DNA gyrase inhibitor YacG [Marinospirillum minutulum]|uniref:DNA gyrase inhibitor YacG n=1 Tax=Marinospirillum minutulum TaxID=64974 RepID=UPI0003FFBC1A